MGTRTSAGVRSARRDQLAAKAVEALRSRRVALVSGGWRHTVAADEAGNTFSWGWNKVRAATASPPPRLPAARPRARGLPAPGARGLPAPGACAPQRLTHVRARRLAGPSRGRGLQPRSRLKEAARARAARRRRHSRARDCARSSGSWARATRRTARCPSAWAAWRAARSRCWRAAGATRCLAWPTATSSPGVAASTASSATMSSATCAPPRPPLCCSPPFVCPWPRQGRSGASRGPKVYCAGRGAHLPCVQRLLAWPLRLRLRWGPGAGWGDASARARLSPRRLDGMSAGSIDLTRLAATACPSSSYVTPADRYAVVPGGPPSPGAHSGMAVPEMPEPKRLRAQPKP